MNRLSVLVGITEGSVVIFEHDVERGRFSLSGMEYDKAVFNEDIGERRAKEYLQEGELWRMAVDSERTVLGLNEWVDMVIDIDGWELTVGDVEELDNGLYTQLSSCG